MDTKSWKIEQIRRANDSDMRVSIERFEVLEAENAALGHERFPWLIKSEQGFTIDINRCSRDSEVY